MPPPEGDKPDDENKPDGSHSKGHRHSGERKKGGHRDGSLKELMEYLKKMLGGGERPNPDGEQPEGEQPPPAERKFVLICLLPSNISNYSFKLNAGR